VTNEQREKVTAWASLADRDGDPEAAEAIRALLARAEKAERDAEQFMHALHAAEADNAALLTLGNRVANLAQHDEACRMLVGDDLDMCDCAIGEWHEVQRRAKRGEHPGAALLAELEALRRVKAAVTEILPTLKTWLALGKVGPRALKDAHIMWGGIMGCTAKDIVDACATVDVLKP
jgi:hypothetical protein